MNDKPDQNQRIAEIKATIAKVFKPKWLGFVPQPNLQNHEPALNYVADKK